LLIAFFDGFLGWGFFLGLSFFAFGSFGLFRSFFGFQSTLLVLFSLLL
jgi:hypothetical protein|tara:strand:+ start:450 stop:593 length:144 start_codon:yes stop_codon:yes gene_type:complete